MFVQEIPPAADVQKAEINVDTQTPWMLPEDFRVYVHGGVVINHRAYGFEERVLPTVNHYMGADGGYVAIYTLRSDQAIYGVGGGIYVAGQIRVPGKYVGRIFIPAGYLPGDDITQDPEILAICEEYFPELKGDMWIGGDTGGWFGIQLHSAFKTNI